MPLAQQVVLLLILRPTWESLTYLSPVFIMSELGTPWLSKLWPRFIRVPLSTMLLHILQGMDVDAIPRAVDEARYVV